MDTPPELMSAGEITRTLHRIDVSVAALVKDMHATRTKVEVHEVRLDDHHHAIRSAKQIAAAAVETVNSFSASIQKDDNAIRIPVNAKTLTALVLSLATLVAALVAAWRTTP